MLNRLFNRHKKPAPPEVFTLVAYTSPITCRRIFTIEKAEAVTPDYLRDKNHPRAVFTGSFAACVQVRIATGTNLKKNLYSTLDKVQLQTVFN